MGRARSNFARFPRETGHNQCLRKRNRILLAGLLVVTLGFLAWVFLLPQDRMFHGKRVSDWIQSLASLQSGGKSPEWQAFGIEGVPVLTKALGKRNGPLHGIYATCWPKLPASLRSRFPNPVDAKAIRAGASFALLALGPDAKSARPELCRALEDPVRTVRMNAITCLNGLVSGMDDAEKAAVLPALLKAMESKDVVMRYQDAMALGHFPDQAPKVIPALMKALEDPDAELNSQAMHSLDKLQIEPSAGTWMAPLLIKCLKNKRAAVRTYAATKLGMMGKEPELAVPALAGLLGDEDPITAYRAAAALGKFGDKARGAIPALLKASETAVPLVRYGATNALIAIDPAGHYQARLQ
jgi:hypothetical protein